MKENRDFKGIWIPKEIWLSKELTLQEKVFLVEISSLDNEEGCFANNAYFADFFGISKTRVSIVINSLVEKKYITSTMFYKEGSKQILKRVLNVCYIGYARKVIDPIQEKFKDNNTINNTFNNTFNKEKEKQAFQETPKEVLPKHSKKQLTNPLYPASFTEALVNACNSFFDYRKEIKKPYKTEASMQAKISQFKAQAEKHGEGFVIFSINETLSNGWQGTFADDKMIKNYLASQQTTNNHGKQINGIHPKRAETIQWIKESIEGFDINSL